MFIKFKKNILGILIFVFSIMLYMNINYIYDSKFWLKPSLDNEGYELFSNRVDLEKITQHILGNINRKEHPTYALIAPDNDIPNYIKNAPSSVYKLQNEFIPNIRTPSLHNINTSLLSLDIEMSMGYFGGQTNYLGRHDYNLCFIVYGQKVYNRIISNRASVTDYFSFINEIMHCEVSSLFTPLSNEYYLERLNDNFPYIDDRYIAMMQRTNIERDHYVAFSQYSTYLNELISEVATYLALYFYLDIPIHEIEAYMKEKDIKTYSKIRDLVVDRNMSVDSFNMPMYIFRPYIISLFENKQYIFSNNIKEAFFKEPILTTIALIEVMDKDINEFYPEDYASVFNTLLNTDMVKRNNDEPYKVKGFNLLSLANIWFLRPYLNM